MDMEPERNVCVTNRVIFLDRDGVINRDSDYFIKSESEFDLLPGSANAIARLGSAGFKVFVITNQSGIGRGLFTEEDLAAIHNRMNSLIVKAGGHFDGIYHCPHRPEEGCNCRKPRIGLIERAIREHGVDSVDALFVGDKPADITCGKTAGCRTVLVLSGKTASYDPAEFGDQPDGVFRNLEEMVNAILFCETTPNCK